MTDKKEQRPQRKADTDRRDTVRPSPPVPGRPATPTTREDMRRDTYTPSRVKAAANALQR